MRPGTYEITFTGRADKTLRAPFDARNGATGPDTTTSVPSYPTRPVIADLTTLSFCDAQGLAALVPMAGYAEQMGCTFRLASPSLSLVKIMRITGLDRRFFAFQVPKTHGNVDQAGEAQIDAGGSRADI